jgi:hypothetical protein
LTGAGAAFFAAVALDGAAFEAVLVAAGVLFLAGADFAAGFAAALAAGLDAGLEAVLAAGLAAVLVAALGGEFSLSEVGLFCEHNQRESECFIWK